MPDPMTDEELQRLAALQPRSFDVLRPVIAPPVTQPDPETPPLPTVEQAPNIPVTIARPPAREPQQRPYTPVIAQTPQLTSALNAPSIIGRPTATPIAPAPAILPGNQTDLEKKTASDQAKLATLQSSKSGVDQMIAKPGVWNKISGIAAKVGEIAGGAMFPSVVANIPGTQLHHNQLVRQQRGIVAGDLEQQKTEAEIAKDKADAQAKLTPKDKEQKAEPVFDKAGNLIGFRDEGNNLLGPNSEKLTQDMKDMLAAAKPKPAPVKVAHVTYDQGIPVHIVDSRGETHDINDPNLPAELKPLVNSAFAAHKQHLKEQEAREGRIADRQAAAADRAEQRRNKPKPLPQATAVKLVGDKDAKITEARQALEAGYDKAGTPVDMNEYLNRWQAAQDDFENKIAAATGQQPEHTDIRSNVDDKGVWKNQAQVARPTPKVKGPAPVTTTLDKNNPQHVELAKQYLQKAGGDKNKARQLAQSDGYTF